MILILTTKESKDITKVTKDFHDNSIVGNETIKDLFKGKNIK